MGILSSARCSAVVVAAALLGAGVDARADEGKAAARFQEGASLYARAKYRPAAEAFEAAFREDPRGASMYNAGIAWEAAGAKTRAADDYEKAAAAGLDAAQTKDAATRLAALRKKLGRLQITAPGGVVSVDGTDVGAPPVQTHVEPGGHDVAIVSPDGAHRARHVDVAADASATVVFEPDPPPLVDKPAKPAPTRDPATAARLWKAGWITVGASGLLALVAVPVGVAALGARNTFNASGYHDQSSHDQAAALQAATNVLWVGAGVLAATGVSLVVAGWPSAAQTRASGAVELRVGPRGIGVAGRF